MEPKQRAHKTFMDVIHFVSKAKEIDPHTASEYAYEAIKKIHQQERLAILEELQSIFHKIDFASVCLRQLKSREEGLSLLEGEIDKARSIGQ